MTQTAFPNHAPAMDSHLENSEIGPEAKVIVQEGFYLIFLLFIYFDSLSAKATSHWTREQFYQRFKTQLFLRSGAKRTSPHLELSSQMLTCRSSC